MNLAQILSRQLSLGPRCRRGCCAVTFAILAVAAALSGNAQIFSIRSDFDSATNWINAAPPGAILPEHTTAIVTDGGNSIRWEVHADQPNSFLVGLPLAEPDPGLNEFLAPMADNSAQARFHVDGGQPKEDELGVQVAIVSRFSTGAQDLPQGYCLLVGDGRLDLARFDLNGPPEP